MRTFFGVVCWALVSVVDGMLMRRLEESDTQGGSASGSCGTWWVEGSSASVGVKAEISVPLRGWTRLIIEADR